MSTATLVSKFYYLNLNDLYKTKMLNFILIDDSSIDLFINQKTIEKTLLKSSIRVFTSGISALNHLTKLENVDEKESIIPPDIIFLDINMPEMNGFEFILEFKKIKIIGNPDIKIYLLSSSASIVDVQKAKQEKSCDGYLNKPLTIENLQRVLNQ